MNSKYYLKALFVMLAFSVAITEARHGVSQVIFIFIVYIVSFLVNQYVFKPDLKTDDPKTPPKSLYFRGAEYDSMENVQAERLFLAMRGSTQRIYISRWVTRGLFAVFVIAFF